MSQTILSTQESKYLYIRSFNHVPFIFILFYVCPSFLISTHTLAQNFFTYSLFSSALSILLLKSSTGYFGYFSFHFQMFYLTLLYIFQLPAEILCVFHFLSYSYFKISFMKILMGIPVGLLIQTNFFHFFFPYFVFAIIFLLFVFTDLVLCPGMHGNYFNVCHTFCIQILGVIGHSVQHLPAESIYLYFWQAFRLKIGQVLSYLEARFQSVRGFISFWFIHIPKMQPFNESN